MGRWAKSMMAMNVMAVVFSAIVGCGGGGGGGGDNTPPLISGVQVKPTSLRFFGGTVTITAQVSDPSGVAEVWAEVEKPSGEKSKVTMNLVGGLYQGEFKTSPNIRNDGQAETYKVWVRARDGRGNQTPEPGEPSSFSVSAPLSPPEKPSF